MVRVRRRNSTAVPWACCTAIELSRLSRNRSVTFGWVVDRPNGSTDDESERAFAAGGVRPGEAGRADGGEGGGLAGGFGAAGQADLPADPAGEGRRIGAPAAGAAVEAAERTDGARRGGGRG